MKIFVVLLLFNIVGYSQTVNQLDANGNKHGLWRGYYEESKRLRYEGVFDHGKESGVFKYFDDTQLGTVIATRDFSANDGSCYTTFFNQSNNKVSEGKVVNKQFEGEWKYYHKNSPAIMTIEVYSKGKLNGLRKVFYKSGAIAEEAHYKDGKRNGLYKKYAENGILLEESNFLNDQYEGKAIFRSIENTIASEGIFKNGKKIGVWKVADEKGVLKNVNMNKQRKKFQKRVKPVDAE